MQALWEWSLEEVTRATVSPIKLILSQLYVHIENFLALHIKLLCGPWHTYLTDNEGTSSSLSAGLIRGFIGQSGQQLTYTVIIDL